MRKAGLRYRSFDPLVSGLPVRACFARIAQTITNGLDDHDLNRHMPCSCAALLVPVGPLLRQVTLRSTFTENSRLCPAAKQRTLTNSPATSSFSSCSGVGAMGP